MTCTRPMWRFEDHGKVKFFPPSDKPRGYTSSDGTYIEPQLIPCGQCMACRLNYSRMWADRLIMEKETTPEGMSWFCSFTYDDDHLPAGDVLRPSLCPADHDKLIHDIRQKMSRDLKKFAGEYDVTGEFPKLRYYSCGEYGDEYGRPHFHSCMYNLPLLDLKYYRTNENGDVLYTSDWLSSCWSEGKKSRGFVVVGELNYNSAAYTARYVTKKIKGKHAQEYYDKLGIVPEFSRCSRKPGIGFDYMKKNFDRIFDGSPDQHIYLPSPSPDKSGACMPPKYFLRKADQLTSIDPQVREKAFSELDKSIDVPSLRLILAKMKSQVQNAAETQHEASLSKFGYDLETRYKFLEDDMDKKFISKRSGIHG